MDCDFQPDGNKWRCQRCGTRQKVASRRNCRLTVIQPTRCPYAAVVSHLTVTGVDRLQFCRAADCHKMQRIDGVMRCLRLGANCDGTKLWAAWLNSEGRTCPHWKPCERAAS